MARVTRRGFLTGALGVVTAGLVSMLGVGVYCSRREDLAGWGERGPDRLARALRDPAGARRIGVLYLERHPEEADPTLLEARIAEGAELDGVRCPTTAATALAAAGRRDFREGRTVQVEGWVLGRTELRLCAWVATRT